MRIGILKSVVLIIGDPDHAVLYSKCIEVIYTYVPVGKFNGPIRQISSVKKENPFLFFEAIGLATGKQSRNQDGKKSRSYRDNSLSHRLINC